MRIIQDIDNESLALLKRGPAEVELPPSVKQQIREVFGKELTAEEIVKQMIRDIRAGGDCAVLEYVEKLDGARLSELEVPKHEIVEARNKTDEKLLAALEEAGKRIKEFHEKQLSALPIGQTELMKGLWQIIAPLERVGVYAPGGTASYPSTVLMTAIPAKAAGVREVVLATPPHPDGHVPALTLTAAGIAEIDRVFAVGGVPAIATLAFGTETVHKVDKVCGPGNVFVLLAKREVFGTVGIDGLQGPTETVILADDSTDPVLCAADILAQAEHDEMASAIMITTSSVLAEKVSAEVQRQLPELERADIARKSLEQNGAVIVTSSMDRAIDLVNTYAPEHLCLTVHDAHSITPRIQHTGGIFIGSPEVLGDYIAGPSHVMPTGGTARFSSPINVTDFLKLTTLVELNEKASKELGPQAATIARSEGLTAHAKAVEKRI